MEGVTVTDLPRPKVLFVVWSQLFVRNYFRTDALEQLERDFDVTFLVSDEIVDIGHIEKEGRNIVRYRHDRRHQKKQYKSYKVLMWRFRRRSSTFQFRSDRMFEPKRPMRPWRWKNALSNVLAIAERAGISYRRSRLRFLASDWVFPLFRYFAVDRPRPAAGIADSVARSDAHLIIAPSSAFDPDGVDVIKQARASGKRTLFLIDNWDNLSSKCVMLIRPDHVAVWGEQSAGHAVTIQDFQRDQVSLIGTPRFDSYFAARRQSSPSPFSYKYILFLGTALAFDEVSALVHLDEVLDRNQDMFSGVKIVYRPHPWRESQDSIAGVPLRHVLLDPQLEERHLLRERGIGFQPDLGYYPKILSNAEIIVGGLTSMLIEATIFGKDYVALTYDDGKNITNQRTVLERSEHFRGVERIPSVSFCKDIGDVEPLLRRAWNMRGRRDLREIDQERQYILYHDDRPYKSRLADLAQQQLALHMEGAARQRG